MRSDASWIRFRPARSAVSVPWPGRVWKASAPGRSEIWRARTPIGRDSRQLYLPATNERANRTWLPLPAGGPGEDGQGRVTVLGNPGGMASWRRNLSAIDLVYRGTPSAGVEWVESRCPCAGISRNASTELVLQVADLCWKSAHSWRAPGAHAGPACLENVFELLGHAQLGHAGEFFLDSVRSTISSETDRLDAVAC